MIYLFEYHSWIRKYYDVYVVKLRPPLFSAHRKSGSHRKFSLARNRSKRYLIIVWSRYCLFATLTSAIPLCGSQQTIINYRLLHCGDLRAFLRPNFLRSFALESRLRKPNVFKFPRKLISDTARALESP